MERGSSKMKEVINVNDCSYIGHIQDMVLDINCGKICEIIIPGPGKYLGCLCRDYEYCIPWVKILKIGPDIILVDIDEETMRRKI